VGMYLVQDGTFQYVNPTFARIHGYEPNEMIGKLGIIDIMVSEDASKYEERGWLSRAGQAGSAPNDTRIQRKDGLIRDVRVNESYTTFRGKPAYIGTMMDITKEKQTQLSLARNRARVQTLVDASPVGVMWSDLEGNIEYLNQRFVEMFGYTMEEIPTVEEWRRLAYPSEEYRTQVSGHSIVPRQGSTKGVEASIRCKDGSFKVVRRARALAADRIIVIFMDMTEQVRAETALRENEERLQAFLDFSPNPVVLSGNGPDFSVKYINRAFEQLFGYSKEEIPTIMDWCLKAYPDPEYREQVSMALKPGQTEGDRKGGINPDAWVTCKDEIKRYVWRDLVVTHWGSLATYVDLTDLKKAEMELAKKADELARSNAELEQFAYVASHDLQEPLRMVASYTELIARRYKGRLDDDADEFIGYAVDGANRMKRLINDLLAYSRVGTRGKKPEPTSADSALRQALSNLSMAIEEKGARVKSEALPLVLADESQLIQLFQNLISNAIKFNKETVPEVHISAHADENQWIFAVRDNGIGIEPEYFERVFLIFQRLHRAGAYPGTGVGLAVCKRIVERHGGRIWVESEPGKGSTFFFTFPMKGADSK
jgi:PAS domain S-box-containing protein